MPANEFTSQILVQVDGAELSPTVAALLVQAVVDDSRTAPDLFLLRFRDVGNTVLDKASIKIGSKVTLAAASSENAASVPLLTGEVTALEKEFDGTGTYTTVRGLDMSHRLQRGRRVTSHRQTTAADIATRIAREAGLRPGRIDNTPVVYDQVSQANVSDWEFLQQLAVDAGAQVSVVDGKLDFRRPTEAEKAPDPATRAADSPVVLELGRNLLRLRTSVTSADQVPTVQVRGWDVAQKRAVVSTSPAKTSTVDNGARPASLAGTFSAPGLVVTDTPYRSQDQVDEAAKAVAERVATGFAELEGVLRGNPRVRSGTAATLANAGQPFDGKYTVTTSRHVWDPDTGYTTWVTVSGFQDRTLLGLTGAGGSVGATRIPGVVIAQVSANNDPDDLGRVRLTLPWLSDDFVSDWARSLQAGGGADRGAVVVPEIGDEVLVAFEQGDFQRPYVLGGLHNGVDKLPRGDDPLIDSTSGAVNRRAFVSRTGHAIEFAEAANGPQGIRLRTGDGKLSLQLDAKQTRVAVSSDGSVTVEAKNGVTVDAGTGTLRLTGQDISLEAETGVKVDGGGGEVKLTSNGQVGIEGATVSVNGRATSELKAGATCTIQAGLVRIN